ncbi:MAG: NusG domain II-containing protein [Clostridia bacterium]|nr:NusG domain II-containing protein [Clostridia bacterium]
MSRPFFRPVDLLPLLLALAASLALAFLPNGEGRAVEVRVDGEVVATLPLDRDTEVACRGLTVVVADGAAYIKDADCPDKLCEKAGKLTKAGDVAVCLPNRVTLTVTGTPAADGVTY